MRVGVRLVGPRVLGNKSSDEGSGERQRLEACRAEDVEMDLAGTAIPDDEFHEEPHLEEAKVPEEIPNAVRLAILRIHKKLEHPSKELLRRALRNGGANRIATRAASQLKCDACSENKPPKSPLRAKLADTYTEFNQGVGVDLFVLAGSDEQVCKFLNKVDLATRFNICFPVPSKGPDDVLSALEIVWISWAGSTNHLVSDMGGEFEGELGEFMEAHGIRQYFTASEDPWQTGLLNAMAESGRRLPGRQSKMSGLEVSWKCEDSPP